MMSPGKLWSHSVAQAPAEAAPGELEALSGRYSSAVLIILPLRAGNWAIFGADRQLIELSPISEPDWLNGARLRMLSKEAEARISAAVRQAETRSQARSQAAVSTSSAEDLGL